MYTCVYIYIYIKAYGARLCHFERSEKLGQPSLLLNVSSATVPALMYSCFPGYDFRHMCQIYNYRSRVAPWL